VIISLIVPLDNLGFARHDVHLMTDRDPRNLPTKNNIVRRPCEMPFLRLHFAQLGAMRALVADAQPGDSFFFYCTRLGLDKPMYIDEVYWLTV
jgi:hypothetical protein